MFVKDTEVEGMYHDADTKVMGEKMPVGLRCKRQIPIVNYSPANSMERMVGERVNER